eukprot:72191_1
MNGMGNMKTMENMNAMRNMNTMGNINGMGNMNVTPHGMNPMIDRMKQQQELNYYSKRLNEKKTDVNKASVKEIDGNINAYSGGGQIGDNNTNSTGRIGNEKLDIKGKHVKIKTETLGQKRKEAKELNWNNIPILGYGVTNPAKKSKSQADTM